MTQHVYAGAAPFSGASDTTQPGGLFRLAVCENEWRPLSQGLPDRTEVRAIAIHPHNPQIVYVGAQDGPYRSLDGGDHWQRLNFPEKDLVVWSILFHPKNPQTMYVGTAPTAIYRSDNGGGSLERLPPLQPAGRGGVGVPPPPHRLSPGANKPQQHYTRL